MGRARAAVLFDANGTLFNDAHIVCEASIAVFRLAKIEPLSPESYFQKLEEYHGDVVCMYCDCGIRMSEEEIRRIYRTEYAAAIARNEIFLAGGCFLCPLYFSSIVEPSEIRTMVPISSVLMIFAPAISMVSSVCLWGWP